MDPATIATITTVAKAASAAASVVSVGQSLFGGGGGSNTISMPSLPAPQTTVTERATPSAQASAQDRRRQRLRAAQRESVLTRREDNEGTGSVRRSVLGGS